MVLFPALAPNPIPEPTILGLTELAAISPKSAPCSRQKAAA
jgi:hypothetical protein